MSSNYEILIQKFNNFKKFVKENSKSPKVALFESYSDAQFLQYSAVLVHFHTEGKLREIVDKTIEDLAFDPVHADKINLYYKCFCDYLDLMVKARDKMVPEIKEPTSEERIEIEQKIKDLIEKSKKDN